MTLAEIQAENDRTYGVIASLQIAIAELRIMGGLTGCLGRGGNAPCAVTSISPLTQKSGSIPAPSTTNSNSMGESAKAQRRNQREVFAGKVDNGPKQTLVGQQSNLSHPLSPLDGPPPVQSVPVACHAPCGSRVRAT